jgi:hypothetical protein
MTEAFMRYLAFTALAVTLFAGNSFAQLSPEEARAKLAERRQLATTQPNPEIADLKSIIADLRSENAGLKEQIAALEDRLKKPDEKPITPIVVIPTAATDYTTINFRGMTVAQAEAVANTKFYPVNAIDGVQVMQANIFIPRDPRKDYFATSWSIFLFVRDGKVEHSKVDKHQDEPRGAGEPVPLHR